MKNNTLKKIICCALCAVTVLSMPLSAIAAEVNSAPVIYVGEISDNALYKNPNKNGSEVVFDVNSSAFIGSVTKVLAGFLLEDSKQSATPIAAGIKEIMTPILCAPTGASLDSNVGAWYYAQPISEYKADTIYSENMKAVIEASAGYVSENEIFFFSYDWRMDPFDNAEYLYDFIDHVKVMTNSKKVSLLAVGSGGVVVNTYLHEHEDHAKNSVASIVFFNCSLLGNAVIGDFMKGRVARLAIDEDNFLENIPNITGEHRGNAFMDFVSEDSLKIISGISGNLLGAGSLSNLVGSLFWEIFEMIAKGEDLHKTIGKGYNNFALSSSADAIFNDFLKEYLRNMPGLWALVPQNAYADAVEFMFDLGAIENDVLADKIIDYRKVLSDTAVTLNTAKNNGINVNVVAGYGLQILPVTISLDDDSDSIESTKYASVGAVTADNSTEGGHFSYCLSSRHNHKSPAEDIDASYCALPESTWFINKLPHGDMSNSSVADFVVWLLFSRSQRTVRENASYPQYLKYNKYGALKAASAIDENELFAGDVDSDGVVKAADARLALRISVGLENASKETKLLADVDGDGAVKAADARLILRYSVGLETSFPVNK